ncbi:GNAT family N-acetyltransferase [Gordonia hydrophobica]|uniref:GNAT family N-acetyltransferase n=1 Tax=Gordonia hydrophobica TaxID=40516 RepID=A0ABZ2U341_9ACTN|nr:GNAT family N-acetyltransferase [Gordonia hydrophobica]MBM7367384.1 GNAT superfamily N-acetyltransferase [Gordonia hydrophobica]
MTHRTVNDDELVSVERYLAPPRSAAHELIARARDIDESMGFGPPPGWRLPPPTSTIEIHTALHRWSVTATDRPRLAGVITLCERDTVDGSDALIVVDLVVAPEFRSTGVATAAVEHLLTVSPALFRSQATACAYGSHPAALRLAARFGADVRTRRHHLLRHSTAPEPHAEPGSTATSLSARWRVLGEELPQTPIDRASALRSSSAIDSIAALVDADDNALIDRLRSLAFSHDRTDTLVSFSSRTPT